MLPIRRSANLPVGAPELPLGVVRIGQYALVPIEIARAKLHRHHGPTGATRHFFGLPDDPNRVEAPGPAMLRIVQYEDTWGYYLFYCDADGVEFTDTLHETIAAAKDQAEFEFGVRPDEWENA